MRLSELEAILQKARAAHGDIRVVKSHEGHDGKIMREDFDDAWNVMLPGGEEVIEI